MARTTCISSRGPEGYVGDAVEYADCRVLEIEVPWGVRSGQSRASSAQNQPVLITALQPGNAGVCGRHRDDGPEVDVAACGGGLRQVKSLPERCHRLRRNRLRGHEEDTGNRCAWSDRLGTGPGAAASLWDRKYCGLRFAYGATPGSGCARAFSMSISTAPSRNRSTKSFVTTRWERSITWRRCCPPWPRSGRMPPGASIWAASTTCSKLPANMAARCSFRVRSVRSGHRRRAIIPPR